MNTSATQSPTRTLSRPTQGRLLAGVAAGLARYLDLDVALVRVAFAALALMGGAGLPVYLAAWLLMPEEGAQASIAAEFLQAYRPTSR